MSEPFAVDGLNFLIVDDSTSMRKIIIRAIKPMGKVVFHEAHSGKNALTVLKEQPVDFIVCDWNMPGMTGIELLRALRADDKYKALPFLMVSAESKTENIMEAIQNGVNNYLPKPFNPDVLRKKIQFILESKEQEC